MNLPLSYLLLGTGGAILGLATNSWRHLAVICVAEAFIIVGTTWIVGAQ